MAPRTKKVIDGDIEFSGTISVFGGLEQSSDRKNVSRLVSTVNRTAAIEARVTEAESEIGGIIENYPTYTEAARARFVTVYTRSSTTPAAPTDAAHTGWYTSVPTSSSDAIWMTGADIDFDGTLIGTWYTPVRFTGASTTVAVLTNEQHAIPTDEDGANGNYTDAESTMLIYEGSVDTSSLWAFSAVPSASITGTLTLNRYVVTNISNDAGSVTITASRSGYSSISKVFSLTRSRLGDPVPVYRMSAESVVVQVYVDGSVVPSSVDFDAYSSVGLATPTAYAGIFKIYVNDVLQYESPTPISTLTWSGYKLYPADGLYGYDGFYPPWQPEDSVSDIQLMLVQLYSADGTVLLDSQSVVFLKNVGFSYQDIADSIDYETRTPKYLGKFNQSASDVP